MEIPIPLVPAPAVGRWSLVDVLVLVAVVLAVVGALRRRSGVLGAVGAGLGTLVVAWLLAVAVSAWAPRPIAAAAERSHLLHVVPSPHRALAEATSLVDRLVGDPGPSRPRP